MKLCKICGIPIYGRSRKYCEKCKREVHLDQMHQNYINNTSKWQYGGEYWNARKPQQKIGTTGLGEHALDDKKKEYVKIQKELRNLNLREKKEFWRN